MRVMLWEYADETVSPLWGSVVFAGGGGGEWSRRRPHFHCQCTHIHTGTLWQCICSVSSTDKEQCRRREEERKESQRPVPTEDRQRQLKSRRTVEGKQWCECWPPNETQLFSQIDIQCPIVSMRVCACACACACARAIAYDCLCRQTCTVQAGSILRVETLSACRVQPPSHQAEEGRKKKRGLQEIVEEREEGRLM